MITDQPFEQQGDIVRFGNPFHGPVQHNQLTLPGGVIKAWSQPAIAPIHYEKTVNCSYPDNTTAVGVVVNIQMLEPDIAGFTHSIAPADAPPLPPDLPTDPTHHWRREALLSGAKQQFYGNDLNGWIWCSAPGVRKRVTLNIPVDPVSLTASLTLTGTLDNFGMGIISSPSALSATLPDWRQYGAGQPVLSKGIDNTVYQNISGGCKAQTGNPPAVAPDVANPTYQQGRLTLYAVSPTGDRALIEVSPATLTGTGIFPYPYAVEYESLYLDPLVCRHPIGWLLVTLTPGGMSVSAILSRAETIGSFVISGTPAGLNQDYAFTGYQFMGGFRPNGDIFWFSYSGRTSQVAGTPQFARLTRLNADLSASTDIVEINPGISDGTNAEGPITPDDMVSNAGRMYIRFFKSGFGFYEYFPFRIGNGAAGFLDTTNAGNSAGIEPSIPYPNHLQVLTPLGVAAVAAQTATWPAITIGAFHYADFPNGPHFSSYNHATGEISTLWQFTPICWV